jgi:transcriptional antiterminator RfaH
VLSNETLKSQHVSVYPWYVLRVRTGSEISVDVQLRQRDIASFCPTYQRVRRPKRRKPFTVSAALFPSYVFASFPLTNRAEAVKVPGVFDMLCFAGKPAIVEDWEMERIQKIGAQPSVEPWRKLAEGSRVRIAEGPLSGVPGTLVKHCGASLLVIQIEMLNRQVAVEYDGWAVEAA